MGTVSWPPAAVCGRHCLAALQSAHTLPSAATAGRGGGACAAGASPSSLLSPTGAHPGKAAGGAPPLPPARLCGLLRGLLLPLPLLLVAAWPALQCRGGSSAGPVELLVLLVQALVKVMVVGVVLWSSPQQHLLPCMAARAPTASAPAGGCPAAATVAAAETLQRSQVRCP